jgi:Protein of unknown function (DUF3244).
LGSLYLGILYLGNNEPTIPPVKAPSLSVCCVSNVGNVIVLSFYKNVGEGTVSIEDANYNIAYETNVTAPSGSSISIDTTGWKSGSYTITVTTSVGVIYTTEIDIP